MKPILKVILRIAAWVAALLLCMLPPIFIAGAAGYLPLLTFLLFSVISLVYLICLRHSLVWEDSGEAYACRRGDSMDFGLAVSNKSVLVFPYVKIVLALSDLFGGVDSRTEAEMTIAPREKRSLKMDVSFTHIGEYTVSVSEVKIRGLMGVLSLRLPGGGKHTVTVRPHIWNIIQLPLSQHVQSEDTRAHTSSNIDGMDYIGVREYVIGDQIKNIHWKLSAHSSSYMTKLTETLGSSGLTVILDLFSPEGDADTLMSLYDGLVEGAVSLCQYAIENSMDTDLTFFRQDGERARNIYHQSEELEHVILDLPGITGDKSFYPVENLLEHAAKGLYVKNNVALVTSSMNPQIIQHLLRIRAVGRHPLLLYVVPATLSHEQYEEHVAPLRQLTASEIPWFAYSDPRQLEGGKL